MIRRLGLYSIVLILICGCKRGSDISQWRGPYRNGFYPEFGLMKEWPVKGPDEILRIEGIGTGHSTVVVYKDMIYATGRKDSLDYLTGFNLDGEEQWQVPYGKAWYKSFPDTRCTPTIEKNRIYLISGSGQVACHNAITGEKIWQVNADSLYQGEIHVYGVSESVLLTKNAAIYTTGGYYCSLVALDKRDGHLIWKSEPVDGPRAYASHILIEYQDVKTIIAQTAFHILGLDPENGVIKWDFDLTDYHVIDMGQGNSINTPVYSDGRFFVTSGYDHPGMMFQLSDDSQSIDLLWMNNDIDTHLGGVILKDGYLYASNWLNNSMGRWVCVDWETGELKWDEEWFCKGPIIMAEDLLYIQEEKYGHIGLLKPDPAKFSLISSFQMNGDQGPYWAHPSIYDGRLYLRHGNVVVAYNIKAK